MSCGPGRHGRTDSDIPAIHRDIMVICVHTDRRTFHNYYCLCTMPKKDHPSHCCWIHSGIMQCTMESVTKGHLTSIDEWKLVFLPYYANMLNIYHGQKQHSSKPAVKAENYPRVTAIIINRKRYTWTGSPSYQSLTLPFDHGFTQSIGSQSPCCVAKGAICPSTEAHSPNTICFSMDNTSLKKRTSLL